jgi:hypothetical protein
MKWMKLSNFKKNSKHQIWLKNNGTSSSSNTCRHRLKECPIHSRVSWKYTKTVLTNIAKCKITKTCKLLLSLSNSSNSSNRQCIYKWTKTSTLRSSWLKSSSKKNNKGDNKWAINSVTSLNNCSEQSTPDKRTNFTKKRNYTLSNVWKTNNNSRRQLQTLQLLKVQACLYTNHLSNLQILNNTLTISKFYWRSTRI